MATSMFPQLLAVPFEPAYVLLILLSAYMIKLPKWFLDNIFQGM